MIVPRYWAEARLQEIVDQKQRTLRRFGWSNQSQADAQQMADERVREAMARLTFGEDVRRREPKVAYNGADGVPIREEIVEELGETVITRNSYGARCLNTPNVLFADVDLYPAQLGTPLVATAFLVPVIVAITVGVLAKSVCVGFIGLIVTVTLMSLAVSKIMTRKNSTALEKGGVHTFNVLNNFVSNHPDWLIHVYRTPFGMRLIVTHQLFDPTSEEVDHLFKLMNVDKNYAKMCTRQKCFRARLTAKPWRINIASHIRAGVWPISPEKVDDRNQWITEYEEVAREYASCTFLETLGSGIANPQAERVRSIHDRLSKAHADLPIA